VLAAGLIFRETPREKRRFLPLCAMRLAYFTNRRCVMVLSKRYLVAATWLILSVFTFIPNVTGQQPMDMISCGDAKATAIVSGQELTIMGIEARGINIDNLASKAFDNMTYHTVGVFKVEGGKMTGTMYSKYLDPSGDFLVVEISQVGMERDWKYLYGTGKWKGVTGGGKAIPFTKGQPISPGTIQNCTKITGTYELKK
jgi:hypothetical protein